MVPHIRGSNGAKLVKNMKYELAKELKDAGFPFKTDVFFKEKEGDLFIHPTIFLSELIRECGEEGFVMWEFEGKFYAGKKEDGSRSNI